MRGLIGLEVMSYFMLHGQIIKSQQPFRGRIAEISASYTTRMHAMSSVLKGL